MADVNKLVFAILRFFEDQKSSGQFDDEALESLEVAIQCLEQVYQVNTSEEKFVKQYAVPRGLLDIFTSHLNQAEADFTSSLSLHEATPEQKEEAERLKNKGNDFMKQERFSEALESYSQAIRLDSRNAVYFCNRAAAYSQLNKHQLAIDDCNRALAIDPSYSKAYGRMGIAFTAQENHESAYECYRKALELDPENQSYKNNLDIAEQKMKENAARAGFSTGPAANLGPLGSLGNVDFGTLFSDPNIVNMATTIMSNPQIQQIMSSFMSGSTPGSGSLANLLQASQQMASQMQQANPQLVQQLREQMSSLSQSGNNNNSGLPPFPSSPPPPPSPHSKLGLRACTFT
ncbi:unnamed protein product [Candidula unifasciata]|uniref:SGTA homodimerisation domain-containing protein n=1 Tax=Candidula unifasciata TaxID=100452 RepID=A0A8S3YK22_9EUPU|nr:unnamed protein product [Candidula unifasciata]